MRFRHAVIESIAPALPEEIRTSAELEAELAPLYERLRLPAGRLELMTGIRERRYWPPGTRPSAASARAGRAVLERSRITPDQIDVLVHCAVCRDMLEPATATFVHAELGLPAAVQAFDLSNACLGFLNALVLASGLIDSGQIRSALVVSGENGRPLVEETIRRLLAGDLDRRQIKPYFANLTIGSGAVAAVVCHRELAPGGHRIRGGVGLADTSQSHLCQGDTAGQGLQMQTDSELLLEAGVALAARTWEAFGKEIGWAPEGPDRFICHQVGAAHRRRICEALGLDPERDYSTFDHLGNMGSASLPVTLAEAAEKGVVAPGHRIALLGIGSGIHCLMLGVEWGSGGHG